MLSCRTLRCGTDILQIILPSDLDPMPASFVHLRVHSAYSLAESTLRIKNWQRLATVIRSQPSRSPIPTTCLVRWNFAKAMMVRVCSRSLACSCLSMQRGTGEVVLLAQTERGYANLCQLNSEAC
jgi:DNA polymerase-3 subunit alpha